MARVRHAAAAAGVIMLLLASAAIAQRYNPQQTQINISYHEVIPAGADSAPVFLRIFDRMRHDCELVGKAFSHRCVISQININVNTNSGGDLAGTQNLNANATILLPEPAENSAPSSTTPPVSPAPSAR